MAGKKRTAALYARLGVVEGLLDYILDSVASGTSLSKTHPLVAERYPELADVTYRQLVDWLNADGDRLAQWRQARVSSADPMMDEAEQILDLTPQHTPAQARGLVAKSKLKQIRAAAMDRDTYMPAGQTQIDVRVDVGELHLIALQHSVSHTPEEIVTQQRRLKTERLAATRQKQRALKQLQGGEIVLEPHEIEVLEIVEETPPPVETAEPKDGDDISDLL